MSYTKTNWNNGDVITAEKLNNLEDGIAESSNTEIYVVHGLYYWSDENSSWEVTVTESYNDILNICKSGKTVIMDLSNSYGGHETCLTVYADDGEGYTQVTFYGTTDIDITPTNIILKSIIVDYVDNNWKLIKKSANIPIV